MVNQLGKFYANTTTLTQPLRELIRGKNCWFWEVLQQKAFETIKQTLSSSPVLTYYDVRSATKVCADASSYGLEAVLMQKKADQWRPVAYASRSLSGYSQIDKEGLAITWACERFRDYLIGREFDIETDHKPLVPLLGEKDVCELPPRIQRYRMRLMRYDFTISHVAGRELFTTDALSRAPSNQPSPSYEELEDASSAYIAMIRQSFPASDRRLEEIITHQTEDETCREIRQYARKKSRLKGLAKLYWPHRGVLSVTDAILLHGSRIVIPASLRSDILDKIHEGHQGITKCRELAKNSVWWPNIAKQLAEFVTHCRECSMNATNRTEPLAASQLPHVSMAKSCY